MYSQLAEVTIEHQLIHLCLHNWSSLVGTKQGDHPSAIACCNTYVCVYVQLFTLHLPAQLEDSKQNCLHCDTTTIGLGTFWSTTATHKQQLAVCQLGKVAAICCIVAQEEKQ